MKKIKKMTEERLMHVISESVKRILNEMDPRTYASAREKQNKIDAEYDKRMKDYNGKNVFGRMFSKKPVKPKGYGRGKKFNDAAVNAFNSQYGKDNRNWQTDDRHQTMHDDGSVTQFRPSGDDVFTTSYDFNANQRKAGVKPTGRGIGTVTYGGWNNKTHKDAPKSVRGMENADTDYYYRDGKYKPSFYDKGIKVADQMSFGGGRYEKGKGWVDESQLRRIVSESVKRILAEGWVSDETMSSEEIFNDIIKNFDGKEDIYRIVIRKREDACPYGYFSDYIKDHYDVTSPQCDEICEMIKDYYNLGWFYYDKDIVPYKHDDIGALLKKVLEER